MAEVEARPIEAPEPNDDDFLDRVASFIRQPNGSLSALAVEQTLGSIRVARAFKLLTVELCPVAKKYIVTDHPDPDDTQDHERISGPYHLFHGAYEVKPSGEPEIERTTYIEAAVSLSTTAGGRSYTIHTDTLLGTGDTVTYFEDRPMLRGSKGSQDILDRFRSEGEFGDVGTSYHGLDMTEALITGIRAVRDKDRLFVVKSRGALEY